jgi:hypothetical protein
MITHGIASGRDLLELRAGDDRAGAGLAGVDQRRFSRDGDRLLDRRIERDADLRILADVHRDALPHGRPESRQLGFELVGAGREAEEAEVAGGVGDERLRCSDARQRDGDAGEDRAVLRLDFAVDVSGLELGVGADGKQRDQQGGGNRGRTGKERAPCHIGSFRNSLR